MYNKLKNIITSNIEKNKKKYFLLFLLFSAGICSGAFTVNGLNSNQKDELVNYFYGFLRLFDNQNIESSELVKISFIQNMRLVLVLWGLGVTIVGIPFIYCLVGIRGFATGFSSGFIINMMGLKGTLLILFTLIPKEIIIVPCIIALGVNGINFSLSIIKTKSIKHISKENLKSDLIAYCFSTLIFSVLILCGVVLEAYITPVFIKIIAPIFTI